MDFPYGSIIVCLHFEKKRSRKNYKHYRSERLNKVSRHLGVQSRYESCFSGYQLHSNLVSQCRRHIINAMDTAFLYDEWNGPFSSAHQLASRSSRTASYAVQHNFRRLLLVPSRERNISRPRPLCSPVDYDVGITLRARMKG